MRGLEVINAFKDRLDTYPMEQLRYSSAPGVWSMGQVYSHIVDVALEYLDKIEQCAISSVDQPLGKTEAGEELIERGGFPPIKIKLPPGMEYSPNNEKNKAEHNRDLDDLLSKMREWDARIQLINPNYKIRHGGFGWLNVREWFDLIEMHTRHHLRQQQELEQAWKEIKLS
ncbi:DinB family protein [Paenibacillus lupini]|uniref:DinB family protein n=1 Tax=Paenibacillus lupini TaxID=1450204 RepID=UPI00141FADAE